MVLLWLVWFCVACLCGVMYWLWCGWFGVVVLLLCVCALCFSVLCVLCSGDVCFVGDCLFDGCVFVFVYDGFVGVVCRCSVVV